MSSSLLALGRTRLELALRREALLAQSARQRAQVRLHLMPVARVVGIADRIVGTLREHPFAFAFGVALVTLARRRALLPFLLRLIPLYTLLRR